MAGASAPAEAVLDEVGADPVAEAFRTWLRCCTRSGWIASCGGETVSVREARGRVTGGPVRASRSVPAYRAAAMDGIAVADRVLAQHYPQRLAAGTFAWVDTGDPVPQDADRVIMREVLTRTPDGGVALNEPPAEARHIRPVGEDMRAEDVVLPSGHRIRAVDVAAVAAAGHVELTVRKRPRVAIVPTGDEIRPLGSALGPGEILDTNSLMLEGLLDDAGCAARVLPIVPDQPEALRAVLGETAGAADLVLIIAGSSAGRDDHTGSVVDTLGRVAVHGVAMRPGHPVLLGVLGGYPSEDGRYRPAVPVVGVPGYPGSAERVFDCFVLPFIHRILGSAAGRPPELTARLAGDIASTANVDEFVRVRLAAVPDPGRRQRENLVAVALPRGAGALSTLAYADAVLRVPAGTTLLRRGETVRVRPIPGAAHATGCTVLAGRRSAATSALLDAAPYIMQWNDLSEEDTIDALAAGLCHAAALRLPVSGSQPDPQVLPHRLGPITVLEIARLGEGVEALIVPAAAFDSAPITALRGTLSSKAFRDRLRELPDHCGKKSGTETWHDMTPANGAAQCATR